MLDPSIAISLLSLGAGIAGVAIAAVAQWATAKKKQIIKLTSKDTDVVVSINSGSMSQAELVAAVNRLLKDEKPEMKNDTAGVREDADPKQ